MRRICAGPTVEISIRMPCAVVEWYKGEAVRRGVTYTSLMREAVELSAQAFASAAMPEVAVAGAGDCTRAAEEHELLASSVEEPAERTLAPLEEEVRGPDEF